MLYEDNTEKEVCGYEISGFDNMKVEPQTVTVIYKGYDNLCYNYKKLRGESMKVNYNSTIRSCFIGYIVQAIVNNFVPLLFITFQSQYSIPLSKITLLITINFGLQLIIDFASAFLSINRIQAICTYSTLIRGIGIDFDSDIARYDE